MLHWKLAEKMSICILSSCVALKNEWEKIQLLHVWQIKDIFKTSYSKCHGMKKMINFFHYNFSNNKCSNYEKRNILGICLQMILDILKQKKSFLKQILVSKQL